MTPKDIEEAHYKAMSRVVSELITGVVVVLIFIGIAIAVFHYPIPGVPILIVWGCGVGILRVLQERHIKKRAAIQAERDAERAEVLAWASQGASCGNRSNEPKRG